jgi:nuclear pore complex protein Nup133
MIAQVQKGFRHKNPLHFSFPPELDEESLMRGAEQLSQAVLESGRLSPMCLSFILCLNNRITDPEVVRKNHDLTAQLTGRKERLSWLIKFLNENMVVVKVRQSFLCGGI